MRKTDDGFTPHSTEFRLKVVYHSNAEKRDVSGLPLYRLDGGRKLAIMTYRGVRVINMTSIKDQFLG